MCSSRHFSEVKPLGISPIEYSPWKGKRTDPNTRLLVISRVVFTQNLKSKGVLALLIIGIFLAHTFPILAAVFMPHEEITDEDMVGSEPEAVDEDPFVQVFNITGPLTVDQNLQIDGSFFVTGFVIIGGNLELHGEIVGNGSYEAAMGFSQEGMIQVTGSYGLSGFLSISGLVNENLERTGNGTIHGNGTIKGQGAIFGMGTVVGEIPEEEKDDETEYYMGTQGYLENGLMIIFAMLIAAIICSDIIADDLADSSFVLFFSRPTRTIDYLIGKFIGLSWVMGLFTFIPPILYVIVMMGTQTGDDYTGGLKILGKTVVMGIFTAIYFLPYGLLISSLTKRKAYAGVGIFMSFFVLVIISGIFSTFDSAWNIISPFNMITYTYHLIYGRSLPSGIEGSQLAAAILAITIIPMVIVYIRLHRMGAGK